MTPTTKQLFSAIVRATSAHEPEEYEPAEQLLRSWGFETTDEAYKELDRRMSQEEKASTK